MAIVIVTDLSFKDTTDEQRIRILSAVSKLCHGLSAFERNGALCIGIVDTECEMKYRDNEIFVAQISPLLGDGINIKAIERSAFLVREEGDVAFTFSALLLNWLQSQRNANPLCAAIFQDTNQWLSSMQERHKRYRNAYIASARKEHEEKIGQIKKEHKKGRSGFMSDDFEPQKLQLMGGRFSDSDEESGFSDMRSGFAGLDLSGSSDLKIAIQNEELTFESHLRDQIGSLDRCMIQERESVLARIYYIFTHRQELDLNGDTDFLAVMRNYFEKGIQCAAKGLVDSPEIPSSFKFTLKHCATALSNVLWWGGELDYLEIDCQYFQSELVKILKNIGIRIGIDRQQRQLEVELVPFFVRDDIVERLIGDLRGALHLSGLSHCYEMQDIKIVRSVAHQNNLIQAYGEAQAAQAQALPVRIFEDLQKTTADFFESRQLTVSNLWKQDAKSHRRTWFFKPEKRELAQVFSEKLRTEGFKAKIKSTEDGLSYLKVSLTKK